MEVILKLTMNNILKTKMKKNENMMEIHTKDGAILHVYFTEKNFAQQTQLIIKSFSVDQIFDLFIHRSSSSSFSFSFDLSDGSF